MHVESMGDDPTDSDMKKLAWLQSVEEEAQVAADAAVKKVNDAQKTFEAKSKAVVNKENAVEKARIAFQIAKERTALENELAAPKEIPEPKPEVAQEETVEKQPESDNVVDTKNPVDEPEDNLPVSRPKGSDNWLISLAVLAITIMLLALFTYYSKLVDNQQNEMLVSLRTDLTANTAADNLSDAEQEHQRYILQLSINRSNLKEIEEMGYSHQAAWKLMNKVALYPGMKTWKKIIDEAPKYIGHRIDTNEAGIRQNKTNIDSLVQQIVLKKQAAVEHADQGMKMFTTPDTTKKGK